MNLSFSYIRSQRSISTSSSIGHFEPDWQHRRQEHHEFESRSQSTMSLDSLGRAVQKVAEDKQDRNIDEEATIEESKPESKEDQERRRKAYDTVSIADSTLGW